MERERIKIEILIDLDPVPGIFHTEESARQTVNALLLERVGHYNPIVLEP